MSGIYRRHSEVAYDICTGGNVLGLVSMQVEFEGKTKYLSPAQNEIITLLGPTLHKILVTKILQSPFYAVIFDTTS